VSEFAVQLSVYQLQVVIISDLFMPCCYRLIENWYCWR